MKKNTNERLKLMQKHVALRLLWQMSVDAQKLFLLLGTAAPVTLGGWAGGGRAQGAEHPCSCSGPAGNPESCWCGPEELYRKQQPCGFTATRELPRHLPKARGPGRCSALPQNPPPWGGGGSQTTPTQRPSRETEARRRAP